MSFASDFDRVAARRVEGRSDHKSRKKSAAPFSLRLSAAERERLTVEAAGAPLGTFIRAKLLGTSAPTRVRRSGLAPVDRTALAQVLAMLGRSHLSSNLNQIARAANIGTLPITPETEAELLEAIRDVRAMRVLLLRALGLKAEGIAA